MSARKELTVALAAVRMSEERRRDIERLVERAINEAVDGNDGATRTSAAYLNGFVRGTRDTEARIIASLTKAMNAVRNDAHDCAVDAYNAADEHRKAYGHVADLDVTAAQQIIGSIESKR